MKKQFKDPNPLNFYQVRRLQVLPPHFESINLKLQIYNLEETIVKWIKNNLKGRFFVSNVSYLDASNQITKGLRIGFEDAKELSYFTLACPHLKYK